MRLLVDTHVLVWWQLDDPRLKSRVRAVIADSRNEALISVASFWELSIKARKGKRVIDVGALWRGAEADGFAVLAVTPAHLDALEKLPAVAGHNDPFDHLILAQANAEGVALVTADRQMNRYGVRCIGVA